MPAVDQYAIIANGLISLVNTTFAAEGVAAIHDELHESLGTERIEVGVAPVREQPMPGNRAAAHTLVTIQFFDLWDKAVDPTQMVDPRRITGFHARLKEALRTASIATSDSYWFFQWEGTEYPRDPTGNKTRFVMTVRAWSQNATLHETLG